MIRVVELNKTCHACPSQWEGMTEEGLYVYIRYRWGYLSASVGREDVYGKRIGDGYDGVLDDTEMEFALRDVMEFE